MTGVVIQAKGLGKRYRLGERGYSTVRELLESRLRRRGASAEEEVWALRDVDLEIGSGDIVGIIGRNGAGKTTFLKTVARIVRPTTGVVRVRGRVGALLEVGTGFHPELTGRENVYLNGVVLGMSRREIRRRFDDIVEFAGVERFLDTPLKRYSSGMYLRLAFAVAAHIEPDVVIVDEVLAVGDAEFQRRCLGRMSEFGREGRTVLFVSHDTGTVGRLCQRAMWLENGKLRDDGDAHDVIRRYLAAIRSGTGHVDVPVRAGKGIERLSFALRNEVGVAVASIERDRPLRFELRFDVSCPLPATDVAVYVLDDNGTQIVSENISDSGRTVFGDGSFAVRLTVPPLLRAGEYVAGVWIATQEESLVYREALAFTLVSRPDDREESIRRRRVIQPVVEWEVEHVPRIRTGVLDG